MNVRNTARVTVSDPVNGMRQRKKPAPSIRTPLDHHIKVDPRVMAEAAKARRPGQRIIIVDETTVRIVNA